MYSTYYFGNIKMRRNNYVLPQPFRLSYFKKRTEMHKSKTKKELPEFLSFFKLSYEIFGGFKWKPSGK